MPAGLVGNKSTQVFLGQSVPWNTEESSSQTCRGTGFLYCAKEKTSKKNTRGEEGTWQVIKRQTAMTDSFAQCCTQAMQDLTNVLLGLASAEFN